MLYTSKKTIVYQNNVYSVNLVIFKSISDLRCSIVDSFNFTVKTKNVADLACKKILADHNNQDLDCCIDNIKCSSKTMNYLESRLIIELVSFRINNVELVINVKSLTKIVSLETLKSKTIEIIKADQESILNDNDSQYNVYDSFFVRDHLTSFLFDDICKNENIDFTDLDEELEDDNNYHNLLEKLISMTDQNFDLDHSL